MKTSELHHRHHGDDDLDWVADPPATPRRTPSALWWGLTPKVVARAAAVTVLLGLLGVLLWWLLPPPQPLQVPESFFTDHPSQVPEPAEEPRSENTVFVHVAGEVAEPGLIELPGNARVAEAIERAGGAGPAADIAAINLAAPVHDGEQIYLPAQGENPPVASEGGAGEPGPVNINTATEAELQGLSGIGPVLAERIIAHREANGPFSSVEDLQAVSGIGPSLMGTLRSEITV